MTPQEKQKLNEWTTERIKRFWEACGFKFIPKKEDAVYGNVQQYHWDLRNHWLYPDGSRHEKLPSITDLNALFKWAVPKTKTWEYLLEWAIEMAHAYADGRTLKDPALALCLAIEKLKEGGKE